MEKIRIRLYVRSYLFFKLILLRFRLNVVVVTIKWFYARKQLLLSARLGHHKSVCLSVCPSPGWISQKRCKLGSSNLHRLLPQRL